MVEMLGWCQHSLYEDFKSMEVAYNECKLQNGKVKEQLSLSEEKYKIAHKEQRQQRFWKHVYMVTSGVLGVTLIIKLL